MSQNTSCRRLSEHCSAPPWSARMALVISLRRRAMTLRPSTSGNNAVPFVSRERCLLPLRSTGLGSADELGAAFLACLGGSVATRYIAPDLPGMPADAVISVSPRRQRSKSDAGSQKPSTYWFRLGALAPKRRQLRRLWSGDDRLIASQEPSLVPATCKTSRSRAGGTRTIPGS